MINPMVIALWKKSSDVTTGTGAQFTIMVSIVTTNPYGEDAPDRMDANVLFHVLVYDEGKNTVFDETYNTYMEAHAVAIGWL